MSIYQQRTGNGCGCLCVTLLFSSSESLEASETRKRNSYWRRCSAWCWEQRKPGLGRFMRTDSNAEPEWTGKMPLARETRRGSLRTNLPYFPDSCLLAVEFNMYIFGECGKPQSLSSVIIINRSSKHQNGRIISIKPPSP